MIPIPLLVIQGDEMTTNKLTWTELAHWVDSYYPYSQRNFAEEILQKSEGFFHKRRKANDHKKYVDEDFQKLIYSRILNSGIDEIAKSELAEKLTIDASIVAKQKRAKKSSISIGTGKDTVIQLLTEQIAKLEKEISKLQEQNKSLIDKLIGE